MRLRWKKYPKPQGLARVGAGPRGSTLWDGEKEYASVNASGGGWYGPVKGWYWVSNFGGEYRNTCNELSLDEQTAKREAMAYVKERLGFK